ncbi:response regulator [Acinetobacter thermotolerans]|uniref:response regulator n=1 Tax=Acinetobacter thermotolerans TaxID=3151487 RepID=UPI00384C0420
MKPKQVVKNKNARGLKIWLKLLGYKIKDLSGQGFTARIEDRELQKQIKKQHQYVLVTDVLGGNQAAYELGAEYEMHLLSPDLSDEQSEGFVQAMANQIGKVA